MTLSPDHRGRRINGLKGQARMAALLGVGADTVARLTGLIAEKGIKTFAVIDQAAEAR